MTDKDRVAALDLGSNSFHLVLGRIVADDFQILHQLKLRVQLADGLSEDGFLSAEAMERGLDNLRIVAESLNNFELDQVRIVATYTLRKARNAAEFVRKARKILPYPIEIVSGTEEARLIYLGVAHTNYHDGKRLVIDIGGGSTETIIGQHFDSMVLKSLPMGCVTFAQRYFENGRIKQKEFAKAVNNARQEIEQVSNLLTKVGWSHCLGSSGTVRAIVSFAEELGSDTKPNHVTLKDLRKLADHCVNAGSVEALSYSGFSEQRRQVFPAGLAILTALFESLDIEIMEYSSGALREGVIYEMGDRLANIDIRERTAQSLVTRYVVDVEQADRVRQTTLSLYEQAKSDWRLDDERLRNMLLRAALLHEVGLQINSKSVHKHSEYILNNVEMPGYNLEERDLLATLVRFQRKKIRKADVQEFSQYAVPEVSKLIALLRLGVLLNFKRQNDVLPALELEVNDHEMRLSFEGDWLEQKPIYRESLEQEVVQIKAIGLDLKLQ
ncbi:MAG: exopolyphosphatase/guanosine-5'-triphosphate,3'-diphosphate pyrophosphatase [Candidatus Azotimanducaceae bacterium]|jgi:exopolyphosphatase/guanosine-5'-triphosphate,3'-diphosphate pyrophosphatase